MLKIVSKDGEERLVHPIDAKPFLEAGWQLALGQSQSMVGIAKRIAAETQNTVPAGTVAYPARAVEPMSVQSIKSAPAGEPTITVGQSLPEREGVSKVGRDVALQRLYKSSFEGMLSTSPQMVVANDRVKELEAMHWRELEAIAKELNLTKPEGTSWSQMIPAIIEAEDANTKG
jgi:hypothetical protein